MVLVALGANLGDAQENVRRALQELQQFSAQPLLKSSLWRTNPINCPPGSPKFVNAVVGLWPRARETPGSLLARLQALEKEFGRQRKKLPNEPRPLDLDLIAFGSRVRTSKNLTLPHPRACQRRFVLQPLAEIVPGLILPGQSATIADLLSRLPEDRQMRKIR